MLKTYSNKIFRVMLTVLKSLADSQLQKKDNCFYIYMKFV